MGGRQGGRKSKYETNVLPHLDKIKNWYRDLTEGQIAKKLGVSQATFETYRKKYPELEKAMQDGCDALVDDLKATLKKKAKGFYYEETKVVTKVSDKNGAETTTETNRKYAQPDTGAIHLLLKNYDDAWRNDDRETMDLKKKKLELDKEKAEQAGW